MTKCTMTLRCNEIFLLSNICIMKVIYILFLALCECQENTNITNISSNYPYEKHKTINETLATNRISFNETCPPNHCLPENAIELISKEQIRSCYCDETCTDFRDCCEDSKFYNKEKQRKPRTLHCQLLDDALYNVESRCPHSWDDLDIAEKCASADNHDLNSPDLQFEVPVTSFITNITYGNIFCAICHNVEDFVIWNVTIRYCHSDTTNEAISMTPADAPNLKYHRNSWYFRRNQTEFYCKLALERPKDLELKQCRNNELVRQNVINSCGKNWTNVTISDQCKGIYDKIYFINAVYRNRYCAYCNGLDDTQLTCKPKYYKAVEIEAVKKSFSIDIITPLSSDVRFRRPLPILFNFKIIIPDLKLCRKNSTDENNRLSTTQERVCSINSTTKSRSSKKINNWFLTGYSSIAILISLILLISHLIIFAFVKELHTHGGRNLASFCFALVLSYSNFLIGGYLDGNACFIISIVTYYSFLSAFSWMFTISLDLWITFRNVEKKLRIAKNSKFRFLMYSIWSWTIPAFVVTIAVYFDLNQSDSVLAPHFGGNGCWFQNGYSLLIFFVIPVSALIFINFGLFLHTSVLLRNNQCKSANQKSLVNFKLHARMILLTGFTWITGCIAGYFQNTVFWIIFTVLNATQGAFIFFAFTWKKRIISSFSEKLVSRTVTTSIPEND